LGNVIVATDVGSEELLEVEHSVCESVADNSQSRKIFTHFVRQSGFFRQLSHRTEMPQRQVFQQLAILRNA